jgi:hypothetical protein
VPKRKSASLGIDKLDVEAPEKDRLPPVTTDDIFSPIIRELLITRLFTTMLM